MYQLGCTANLSSLLETELLDKLGHIILLAESEMTKTFARTLEERPKASTGPPCDTHR